MHNYTKLEYCRGELSGAERALTAIRSFSKDEIDVDLMLNAYSIIQMEAETDRRRRLLWVTNEGKASIAFVWTPAHAAAPPNTAGRAEARTHF